MRRCKGFLRLLGEDDDGHEAAVKRRHEKECIFCKQAARERRGSRRKTHDENESGRRAA